MAYIQCDVEMHKWLKSQAKADNKKLSVLVSEIFVAYKQKVVGTN